MAERKKTDWAAIRAEYEAGASQSDLSRKYEISRAAIQKHIAAEGWVDGRTDIDAYRIAKTEEARLSAEKARERKRKYRDAEKEARKDARAARRAHQQEFGDAPGYVYVMRVDSGHQVMHKIGRASSVRERLAVVQSGNPWPVVVVHERKVSMVKKAEATLHGMFSSKRGLGEWFSLDESDLLILRGAMACLE